MRTTVVSYFDIFGEGWEKDNRYHPSSKRKIKKYIRGAKYRLRQRVSVDTSIFALTQYTEKTYRCMATIKNLDTMRNFNGVIMKQLTGPKDNLSFTLSKGQAKIIHLKWEPGLEVFPTATRFERVIERYPNPQDIIKGCFDPEAQTLEDYPHCINDGTIRSIILRLDELRYIETKKGLEIVNIRTDKKYKETKEGGLNGVTLRATDIIKTTKNNLIYDKGEKITTRLFNPKKKVQPNDPVYLELFFGVPFKGGYTEDGYIGLEKSFVTGKTLRDLIEIFDVRD